MDINDLYVRMLLGVLAMLAAVVVGLAYKGIDRKIAAHMQSRIGPPLRQPFRDISKLMQKETITPDGAVDWIFHGMPVIGLVAALLLVLYIPWGPLSPPLKAHGDLILVLYLLIIPSLAMALGGFSSGSPVAAIGAQREMVMMMSYEFPLAIVILSLAWFYTRVLPGSAPFAFTTMEAAPIWGLVGPIGFIGAVLLLLSLVVVTPSELSKIPFDAPEAETELGGGLMAEYSGRDLAMFYIADAVKGLVMAAIIVGLFFPHPLSPIVEKYYALPLIMDQPVVAWIIDGLFFLFKVFLVLFATVTTVRVAFPRLKIDKISYIYLVPVSLMALAGTLLLYLDTLGGV